MNRIFVFLGQKDMLYEEVISRLERQDLIIFDTDKNKKDKTVYSFDLSNVKEIEKNLSICDEYSEVTFIVSDDLFWEDKYSLRIDRLLYGANHSLEYLIYKKNISKINVFFVSKVNSNNTLISDSLFLLLFNNINKYSISGFHKNLNTHLLNIIHNKTYSYDSYAKLELGYDKNDEENLMMELRNKAKRACNLIFDHLENNNATSSINWINDK